MDPLQEIKTTKYVYLTHIFLTLYDIKNKPKRCANTVPALTIQPNMEVEMADSKVRNSIVEEQEVWKPVKEYEGIYDVSNKGRVRSYHWIGKPGKLSTVPRVLNLITTGRYPRIVLVKGDNKTHTRVHQLVAKAFIPNPEDKATVNHIDGDKHNNCVENLEWATQSENNYHKYRTGLDSVSDRHRKIMSECRLGEKHPNTTFKERDIIKIRKLYSTGDYTQREIGDMYNVCNGTIGCIIRRETWGHVDG